jgi:two-component system LytT family response regulator
MYSAIVIDDEPAHRDLLRTRLEGMYTNLRVDACCANVFEGETAIKRHQPNVVFLDIEMPGKSGMDFLKELESIPFEVIFTTSYSEYALEAFRVSAVDYLLKPYEEEQLKEAVDKLFTRWKNKEYSGHLQNLITNATLANKEGHKIALPTASGFLFVEVNEIIRLESQNVYTNYFMRDGRQIVVSRTLKECEEMLKGYRFVRIHQSHMINLRHIKKYTKGEGGVVEMIDGSEVEVSRRKKDEFLMAIGK